VTDKKFVVTGFEVAIKKLPLYGGLIGVWHLDTLHYKIGCERLTLLNEDRKYIRFGLKRNLLFIIIDPFQGKAYRFEYTNIR